MAAPKRTPIKIERDRVEIARLYLAGETQVEIGSRLGMSQQMVSYDLQAIQEQWRLSAIRDFDREKAVALAKIDNLEREYWQGWKRSFGMMEKHREEAEPIGKGKKTQMSRRVTTSEELAGDPRFLHGIERCIDRRIKLLGLDAPIKVQNVPYEDIPTTKEKDLQREFVSVLEKNRISLPEGSPDAKG